MKKAAWTFTVSIVDQGPLASNKSSSTGTFRLLNPLPMLMFVQNDALALQPPVHSLLRSVVLSSITCSVHVPAAAANGNVLLSSFTCTVPPAASLDVELADSVLLLLNRSMIAPPCIALPGDLATTWLRVAGSIEVVADSPQILGIAVRHVRALLTSTIVLATAPTFFSIGSSGTAPPESMQLVALLSSPCGALIDQVQAANLEYLLGWLRPSGGLHGAVLGNIAIAVLLVALHSAILVIWTLWSWNKKYAVDEERSLAEALMFPFNRCPQWGWFPGPSLFVFSFFFAGTTLSSLELLFRSSLQHAGDIAVGALGLCAVMAFGFAAHKVVGALDHALLIGAAPIKNELSMIAGKFFSPRTIWLPRPVVLCYGVFFASAATRQVSWFIPLQYLLTLLELLALTCRLPEWTAITECSVNFIATTVLFWLHAAALLIIRPLRTPCEMVIGVSSYVLLGSISLANYFTVIGESDAARDAKFTLQLLLQLVLVLGALHRAWIAVEDFRTERSRQRVRIVSGYHHASPIADQRVSDSQKDGDSGSPQEAAVEVTRSDDDAEPNLPPS